MIYKRLEFKDQIILERKYKDLRLSWHNIIDANINLVDENKLLKEHIKDLEYIIKILIIGIKPTELQNKIIDKIMKENI